MSECQVDRRSLFALETLKVGDTLAATSVDT